MSTDIAPIEAAGESRVTTTMRWLAAHPNLVLIGVLVALVLVTTAIEPNYLSLTGFRGTAVFAVPIGNQRSNNLGQDRSGSWPQGKPS